MKTVTLAQKAQEILGAEGAKENLDKAPKLIYTVILWYRFAVRSPPRGGGGATKGGRFQGGGGVGSDVHWLGLAVGMTMEWCTSPQHPYGCARRQGDEKREDVHWVR